MQRFTLDTADFYLTQYTFNHSKATIAVLLGRMEVMRKAILLIQEPSIVNKVVMSL